MLANVSPTALGVYGKGLDLKPSVELAADLGPAQTSMGQSKQATLAELLYYWTSSKSVVEVLKSWPQKSNHMKIIAPRWVGATRPQLHTSHSVHASVALLYSGVRISPGRTVESLNTTFNSIISHC